MGENITCGPIITPVRNEFGITNFTSTRKLGDPSLKPRFLSLVLHLAFRVQCVDKCKLLGSTTLSSS